jgi:hypothetical protein
MKIIYLDKLHFKACDVEKESLKKLKKKVGSYT